MYGRGNTALIHKRIPVDSILLYFNMLSPRPHQGPPIPASCIREKVCGGACMGGLCDPNLTITYNLSSYILLARNQSMNIPNSKAGWEMWTNPLLRKRKNILTNICLMNNGITSFIKIIPQLLHPCMFLNLYAFCKC